MDMDRITGMDKNTYFDQKGFRTTRSNQAILDLFLLF